MFAITYIYMHIMHMTEPIHRCCHTLSNLHHRDVAISHFLYFTSREWNKHETCTWHDVLISFYLVAFSVTRRRRHSRID